MGARDDDPAGGKGRPAHSSRPFPRPNRIAAVAGALAALTAAGLGTLALITAPQPTPGGWPSLQPITVSSAATATIGLSDLEIAALLDQPADFGPLGDPGRRASCLAGLGYPASTRVLGARPMQVAGRPAVLLVLPGEQPDTVVALAVAATCSSADTGLLADTAVPRR